MKKVTEKALAQRIGANIKKHRQKSGLSAEKLAYENDFSKSYLSEIENGKKFPTIAFLLKISNALSVEITEFFE